MGFGGRAAGVQRPPREAFYWDGWVWGSWPRGVRRPRCKAFYLEWWDVGSGPGGFGGRVAKHSIGMVGCGVGAGGGFGGEKSYNGGVLPG